MSSMPIICLGVSHHTAPVELRERLTCSLTDLIDLLPSNNGNGSSPWSGHIGELAVISTCNRMEIYARVDTNIEDARDSILEHLSTSKRVALNRIIDHTFEHVGQAAVEHLFSVAAGLDSMVLGEPQILGQVADSYMLAVEQKTIGPLLSALFRTAIRVGKRARTETAIGFNPASISSVAIAKAQQIVGDLRLCRPLLVGMGEMGKLAVKALQARGVTEIAVANRTKERAEVFAEGCGGDAYTLTELGKAIAASDLVVSATAAPHIILYPDMVQEAMAERPDRKLVLIDVAVPRDIDPRVAEIPGVFLFDVDDLQGGLDEALEARQRETPKVEQIVREEVADFDDQARQISVRPIIVEMRQKAETIRQKELRRALRNLGEVDTETLEQIQLFSRSLVNKLLHDPTIRLKQSAGNGESAEIAETVRLLFSLEAPEQ